MKTKLSILLLLLSMCGCTFVGSSPEELRHRHPPDPNKETLYDRTNPK